MLSIKFISAGKEYSTYENHVPAPYFRKNIEINSEILKANITICGLGFYEIYINGKNITKGPIAPYISNPDDILYYDSYNIKEFLHVGKNTIGILLGNGFLNNIGGKIWDFDLARFRSAPKFALSFKAELQNNETIDFEADTSFKTHQSPILFDDLRCGEIYDARCEITDWNMPDFDDSDWKNAIQCETPRGETKICTAEPIIIDKQIKPISIKKGSISFLPKLRSNIPEMRIPDAEMNGYIYDFGTNYAGNISLKIKGEAGQKISMQFGEVLADDGGLDLRAMSFQPYTLGHRVYYTLKGGEEEKYTPRFTYQGFRYCLISGITEEQATEGLLTYNVMHSDLKKNGDFVCSNDVANKLHRATVVSDLSNFFYFPTDCPHREKNGWTGDAALSAEQMLFNLTPENSYRVWLDNIRKAQAENGSLPGIVPTSGWGFEWGNGPAWDSVLIYIPYYTWKYRGDTEIIKENALAIAKYLNYLSTKRDNAGLMHIGLGDWVPIGRDKPKAPLKVTDTLISMDICKKSEKLFDAVGMSLQAQFARMLYNELRDSARMRLIESDCKTVVGKCQTAQAMGIMYGLFENTEKLSAFLVLIDMLEKNKWKLDVGCLGARIIFHVLSDFGYTQKAFEMIVDKEYPSYGHWIEQGATSLFESFQKDGDSPESKNHHFFGDISSWFFMNVVGIKINPFDRDVNELEISPHFIEGLEFAKGYENIPGGKIEVEWKRNNGQQIELKINVPDNVYGNVRLPKKYEFIDDCNDGYSEFELKSGIYNLRKSECTSCCEW